MPSFIYHTKSGPHMKHAYFCKAWLQTNGILKGRRASSVHLFAVPTDTGWQGAGDSPSTHWERRKVHTESGHHSGKPLICFLLWYM